MGPMALLNDVTWRFSHVVVHVIEINKRTCSLTLMSREAMGSGLGIALFLILFFLSA